MPTRLHQIKGNRFFSGDCNYTYTTPDKVFLAIDSVGFAERTSQLNDLEGFEDRGGAEMNKFTFLIIAVLFLK